MPDNFSFFLFFPFIIAVHSIDTPLEKKDAACNFIQKLSLQLLVTLDKAEESIST